jgi:glycosyltransferase involved in cell wall biosynthesis
VRGEAFDISLIATFHREGYIGGWTLDNLARLRREADVAGLSHELICVLDRADEETISVVENHSGLRRQDKVARVDHGDPGMSRNDGVAQAIGEFVAIFDGDDYYSANWLTQAYRTLSSNSALRIVNPEFIVEFGESWAIMRVPNQETEFVPRASLLLVNPWSSNVFVLKAALLARPYQETRPETTGFGHEDWHWNLEMLARGSKFVTAPRTARYYRRKADSVSTRAIAAGAVVRPSVFFRQPIPCGDRQ